MNRQEPVIDVGLLKSRTLTQRIPLSWEEVEKLAQRSAPVQPAAEAAPAVVNPIPFEPQPLVLSEEEKKLLIGRLAPAVAQSLRESLHNAVEMAAANAVTRIKADLERSIVSAIQQSVAREVQKIDLSDIVKR